MKTHFQKDMLTLNYVQKWHQLPKSIYFNQLNHEWARKNQASTEIQIPSIYIDI